jgi:hypothetical protein
MSNDNVGGLIVSVMINTIIKHACQPQTNYVVNGVRIKRGW